MRWYVIAVLLLGTTTPEIAASMTADSTIVPGHVLVEFRRGVLGGTPGAVLATGLPISTQQVLSNFGFMDAEQLFVGSTPLDTATVDYDGNPIALIDQSRWYVVRVDDNADIPALASALQMCGEVEHAMPAHIYQLDVTPNDPDFVAGNQPHLTHAVAGIRAPSAWDYSRGRSDVLIAIVDSGINAHLDLDPGDHSHVVPGYDAANNDNDPEDDNPYSQGHGTMVAGIVGALANNNRNVAGIMWECQLLPIKVIESNDRWWMPWLDRPNISDWDFSKGFQFAGDAGPAIITTSISGLGSGDPFQALTGRNPLAVTTYNAFLRGSVLVASMGNTALTGNEPRFPAAYPWVLAVGGLTLQDQHNPTSSYGDHIDVASLASGTYTTYKSGGAGIFAGTSASTPIVAGVAGLIVSESRDNNLALTNEDVMEVIKRTADPVLGSNFTQRAGHGRVNALRAMQLINAPNAVVHGTAAGGTGALVQGSHERNFLGNSDLPGGAYYGVKRYEVRKHIQFAGPYGSPPEVWARARGSNGWSAESPNPAIPWGSVENVTVTGFDVVAYVYYIGHDVAGRHIGEWHPCQPGQVVTEYTVIGVPPSTGGTISAAGGTKATGDPVSFSGSGTGGVGTYTYEWRWRLNGMGDWSGPVSSSATYQCNMPAGDLQVQLTVQSGQSVVTRTYCMPWSGDLTPAVYIDGLENAALGFPGVMTAVVSPGGHGKCGELTYNWTVNTGNGWSGTVGTGPTLPYVMGLNGLAAHVQVWGWNPASANRSVRSIVPPNAVTNLFVSGGSDYAAYPIWTAPADLNNPGPVHQLDLRYSLVPLTEGTWDMATQHLPSPTPATPGTNQGWEVITGLNPGMRYYFGIKSRDIHGDTSPLSNVVWIDTPDPGGGEGNSGQLVIGTPTGEGVLRAVAKSGEFSGARMLSEAELAEGQWVPLGLHGHANEAVDIQLRPVGDGALIVSAIEVVAMPRDGQGEPRVTSEGFGQAAVRAPHSVHGEGGIWDPVAPRGVLRRMPAGSQVVIEDAPAANGVLLVEMSGLTEAERAEPPVTLVRVSDDGESWDVVGSIQSAPWLTEYAVGLQRRYIALEFAGAHVVRELAVMDTVTPISVTPLSPSWASHSRYGTSVVASLPPVEPGDTVVVRFDAVANAGGTGVDYFLRVAATPWSNGNGTMAGYRRPGDESKTDDESATRDVPQEFAFGGSRPNPARHATSMAFELPEESQVSIEVFDVQGRLVRTVMNARKEPGYHAVGWDGRDSAGTRVAPGVYVTRMVAGKFHDQRKLVLLP